MSYEREAVSEVAPQTPNQQPVMREERVIDPYRTKAPTPLAEATPPPRTGTGDGPHPLKTGQPDTGSPNASPEVPPGTPAESVTLAPAAAALARKEQKFRQSELALREKEKALELERAEIAELKAIKAKLANKDYSGIESLVKYDEFTNYLIEKENASDPNSQALKKLETEIESVKASQKSDVDKRYQAAVNERRKAVSELVEKSSEFSGIKKLKYEEHVVQHILDTWEHDNIDLTPEQAAREVETVLKEKAKEWAALLQSETPPEADAKNLPPLKPGLKTLTNNVTVSGEIKRPTKSFHGMSDSERYAEARRRAEEKLKTR